MIESLIETVAWDKENSGYTSLCACRIQAIAWVLSRFYIYLFRMAFFRPTRNKFQLNVVDPVKRNQNWQKERKNPQSMRANCKVLLKGAHGKRVIRPRSFLTWEKNWSTFFVQCCGFFNVTVSNQHFLFRDSKRARETRRAQTEL